jgi:hypothetical protein
MTRINLGISPTNLHRKHLLAEHREIIRIPNTIKSGKAKVINIPINFVLGTGHVKFFYDKLKYLHDRYNSLHAECIKRNYNVSDYSEAFTNLPSHLYNDYKPKLIDIELIEQRIKEKLLTFKK